MRELQTVPTSAGSARRRLRRNRCHSAQGRRYGGSNVIPAVPCSAPRHHRTVVLQGHGVRPSRCNGRYPAASKTDAELKIRAEAVVVVDSAAPKQNASNLPKNFRMSNLAIVNA